MQKDIFTVFRCIKYFFYIIYLKNRNKTNKKIGFLDVVKYLNCQQYVIYYVTKQFLENYTIFTYYISNNKLIYLKLLIYIYILIFVDKKYLNKMYNDSIKYTSKILYEKSVYQDNY